MQGKYTAIVKEEDGWWIGWIEEMPGVNCQEATYDELMETLKAAFREARDMNRQDALAAAGEEFRKEKIGV